MRSKAKCEAAPLSEELVQSDDSKEWYRLKESRRLLAELIPAGAKVLYRHKWHDEAKLIRKNVIMEISERGFTVSQDYGYRVVDFDGGWTEEHYAFFAPLLDASERSDAAKAVVANNLRRDLTPSSAWLAADDAWRSLRQKIGSDEEDWLPPLVEGHGFAAITTIVSEEVAENRKRNPRRETTSACMDHPHFDSMFLHWRGKMWRIRDQYGPVRRLVEALEANEWRPVKLDNLRPDQVHEAASYLREKTMPHLNWHADSDGRFSWSCP